MEKDMVLAIALEQLKLFRKKVQNRETYVSSHGHGKFADGHGSGMFYKLVKCSYFCRECPLYYVAANEMSLCGLGSENGLHKLHLLLSGKRHADAEELIKSFIKELKELLPSESEVSNQQVSAQAQQQEKKSAVSCVSTKTLFQTALLLGGIIATIVALAT